MTEIKILKTSSELQQAIQILTQAECIGLDTETTGLDPYTSKLRLIQIATAKEAFIIDLFHTPQLAKELKSLLLAEKPIKILHNAKFDLKMLKHHLGLEVNSIFDTILASKLISGGREGESHSLAKTVTRFLGIEIDKSEQTSNWAENNLSESQIEYAAQDALIVCKLYQAQLLKLCDLGLLETAELEFDCVSAIANMELAGMLLDKKRWQEIVKETETKHLRVATELRQALEPVDEQMSLFGESTINLDSPSQVQEALRKLGIPLLDTRSSHLQHLAKEFPILEQLLEYRSLQKALSSYGLGILKFINPVTGRIHANFFQIGTPTGRLSCQEPNLQQIPHSANYRSCFVAAPGNQLIVADYSQIELRILADWACDDVLINAFNSGADLHCITASQMFGIALASVTPEHRSAAKQLNYGIIYGMGPQGLANRINRPLGEAERLIDRYFLTYSSVARWLEQAGRDALNNKQTRTRLGRLMYTESTETHELPQSAIIRLGKNMPIQGTSADISKYAMMLLYRSLAKTSARLINNVHDELVFEVAKDEAGEVAKIIEKEMVAAGQEFIHNVPVIVDLKISEAWLK
ncbi:MAG: DNA-directed DNA polymerase [Acidobacteria bacterium]|nr:DNA-directed DNA polymerase [Acidobacteriota bacterium]